MDGKYAHGRGIEYRRLQALPRLGKSVRDQQLAQLTLEQKELEPRLRAAKDNETRLLAVLEALRRADTMLVINRANALGILGKMEAAEAESKRQAVLIAELEAKLPQGVMEEKRESEALLKAYQQEQRDENAKERELIDKIGQRRGAMNTNADVRKQAATQAYEAFPNLELRRPRHDPPVALERFVGRARASYRKERAARDHPAKVRIYFEALRKDKRASQRSAVSRLMAAVQDYVQANPDHHRKRCSEGAFLSGCRSVIVLILQ
jgi:hypothetical protein